MVDQGDDAVAGIPAPAPVAVVLLHIRDRADAVVWIGRGRIVSPQENFSSEGHRTRAASGNGEILNGSPGHLGLSDE